MEQSLNYKDINPTLKSLAASIFTQFGEDCVVRIFNGKWQHREQGVKMFIEKMQTAFQQSANDNGALLSLNTAVMLTMIEIHKDKVQQIINLSFEATETYVNVLKQHAQITIQSDQGNFERMFCYMLDRLTDSKNFAKCKNSYLRFYEVPQFDVNYLTSFLFRVHSFLSKSQVRSLTHISQRLKIIDDLLSDSSIDVQKLSVEDILFPSVVLCVDANAVEHRKIGHSVTLGMYRQFGFKRIQGLLSNFSQKTLQILAKDIKELAPYVQQNQ